MFETDKFTKVPTQSELYYWADYVEMRCLVDDDGHFGAVRLGDLLNFAGDLAAISADALDADESDVIDAILHDDSPEALFDTLADEAGGDDRANEEGADEHDAGVEASIGRAAELTDDRALWCQNVFGLLRDRGVALGDSYPFQVDGVNITRLDRNQARDAYVFYLTCSLLRYVSQSTMQLLTALFEVVSLDVMRKILPPRAEVDAYGTARGRIESRFIGTQFERLSALATQLRGHVLAEANDFHPRDSGDNGLDLVGWLPMLDQAKGVPSFFAQCACGARWDGKQYEASHERWREFIHLSSPSTKLTFIPHHFRNMGEHWYVAADVSGVLVDRLRAIRFLDGDYAPIPVDVVDSAWSSRLDPV